MRYDEALAATVDPVILAADDSRYLWASEAKVQCGIALGYMKSSTRDDPTIRKCGDAYARFKRPPAPPPPPPSADICANRLAGTVFFDFDSEVLPADAPHSVESMAYKATYCKWRNISVAGHTDRSGSDAYNDALSRRRAEAVAALLESYGISRGAMAITAHGEGEPRVPTADGVREPQNRRVEVQAN
ncbi:MAG: OmpA family protein [Thermomicrobiales bacterium]